MSRRPPIILIVLIALTLGVLSSFGRHTAVANDAPLLKAERIDSEQAAILSSVPTVKANLAQPTSQPRTTPNLFVLLLKRWTLSQVAFAASREAEPVSAQPHLAYLSLKRRFLFTEKGDSKPPSGFLPIA